MKRLGTTLFLLFLLLPGWAAPGNASPGDPMKGPWQRPGGGTAVDRPAAKATHTPAFLVGLYREYISPVDGSQCPMVPSCSQYSLDAFEKHGFFMGWIMTCDRLLRCGRDEIKRSSRILLMGEEKCYDPVENNDFWWSHEK
ncbi:MAG: membrane protein insertion efficiency factor YidD [Thermodesulfobacteriota bacterium]|nr:membrane protein insertion efficiency factor YidD [Thermodesulfobacteriota bacterium]